jgi:hypothetical protein
LPASGVQDISALTAGPQYAGRNEGKLRPARQWPE